MHKAVFTALLIASASTGARAYAPCSPGQSEMSVESVEGIFCVDGTRICIADISDGACPLKQKGLEFGSYCGLVATNVYGCKTLDAHSIKTFQPTTTPVPTTATPAVTSVPPTAAPVVTPMSSTPAPGVNVASNCPAGTSEMSVETVEGYFCVAGGPLCAADVKTGLCPGVETPRLPFGSYCGVVASGVQGCKKATAATATPAPTTPGSVIPGSVTPGSATPASSTPGFVTPGSSTPGSVTPASVTPGSITPASVTPGSVTPGSSTSGSIAPGSNTPSSSTPGSANSGANCPAGTSEMSVETVEGFFCVKNGPACAGTTTNGECPGVSDRLPLGSYCGVVASGVQGCKIKTLPSGATPTPSATPVPVTATPALVTAAPVPATAASPVLVACANVSNATAPPATSSPSVVSADCPNGGTPMSVEGCTKVLCVQGVPCAGSVSNGACPAANAAMGLPNGSLCTLVQSNVYGCKAIV